MRQFINIIREFAFDDQSDRDGDENQTILVFDILWDVSEEEEADLPKRITTTLHDVEEAADPYADEGADLMDKIGDWLMSNYDSRLSNFDYRLI